MKCLTILLFFTSVFFMQNVFACDSQKLLECLNKKGGVTCFYQYSCEQDKYRREYCQSFDLGICLKYEGGKACMYNLDECNYLLEQEKKQKIKNDQIADANKNSINLKIDDQSIKSEKSKSETNNGLNQSSSESDKNNSNAPKVKKKYCSQVDIQECLKHQGGEACFKKTGCDSTPYKKNLCQSFSLDQCLHFGGGKACYKTHSACKTLIANQPKPNSLNGSGKAPNTEIRKTNNKSANKSSPDKLADNQSDTTSQESNSPKLDQDKKNQNQNQNQSQPSEAINQNQEVKCDSSKVAQCEKAGGGDNCYLQYHCTPFTYQVDFCQNYDLSKCMGFQGGQTCQQISKNCEIFLTQNVPNKQQVPEEDPSLKCLEAKATVCLQKIGGKDCFEENHCEKSKFQKLFCERFNYSRCIDNNGGESCQKNQDVCEVYQIENKKVSDNINRNNNFEGSLSLLTDTKNPNHPQNIGSPVKVCDETLRTSDQKNQVQDKETNAKNSLLSEFEKFGKGVKTYSLGTYTKEVTDCSGFIMLAMKKLGFQVNGPQFDLNPNYPQHFKSCDPKNLKPGDVLLLNYPGRIPDHWVMVSGEGSWPSGNIDMMDVSSDYVDGKPFYHGKLNRRSNIRAREVYSCVRHKDFSN